MHGTVHQDLSNVENSLSTERTRFALLFPCTTCRLHVFMRMSAYSVTKSHVSINNPPITQSVPQKQAPLRTLLHDCFGLGGIRDLEGDGQDKAGHNRKAGFMEGYAYTDMRYRHGETQIRGSFD